MTIICPVSQQAMQNWPVVVAVIIIFIALFYYLLKEYLKREKTSAPQTPNVV